MAKVRWDDLSGRQKVMAGTFMLSSFALAVAAWRDLARRPAIKVRGSKRMWALVIGFVYYIGPLLYFRYGRRPDPEADSADT